MKIRPTRVYTWIASLGLFIQGTSTLMALLIPAVDRAVPALLRETQMIPIHSLLHMASGLIGFGALGLSGAAGPRWFALGFGLFYVGLAIAGGVSGQPLCLGLKPFDHSFHAVLGGFGLLAAAAEYVLGHAPSRSNA